MMNLAEAPIRFLFVDDDALVLRSLRRGFALPGCTAIFASDGQEALDIIAREGIDVVVSDQTMPRMNGIELLRTVRGSWPHVVRVMLTGNADQDTAVDAINEGRAFAFLRKPWDDAQLSSVLLAALTEVRRVRALEEESRAALTGRSSVRLAPAKA